MRPMEATTPLNVPVLPLPDPSETVSAVTYEITTLPLPPFVEFAPPTPIPDA